MDLACCAKVWQYLKSLHLIWSQTDWQKEEEEEVMRKSRGKWHHRETIKRDILHAGEPLERVNKEGLSVGGGTSGCDGV